MHKAHNLPHWCAVIGWESFGNRTAPAHRPHWRNGNIYSLETARKCAKFPRSFAQWSTPKWTAIYANPIDWQALAPKGPSATRATSVFHPRHRKAQTRVDAAAICTRAQCATQMRRYRRRKNFAVQFGHGGNLDGAANAV